MEFLFGFSGRVGRGGWWLGQLAVIAILIAVVVLAVIDIGSVPKGTPADELIQHMSGSTLAAILAMLAISTWINVAVTIKRFHDRNKPGVWFLLYFVPYIGSLWILVECGMLAGTEGANNYDRESEYDEWRSTAPVNVSRARAAPDYAATPVARPDRPTGPTGFGRRV